MKKIIVLLMLLLPMISMSVVGQEIKIAIVKTGDVINEMPEVTALENDLVALGKQYETLLKSQTDEYERKYTDFLAKQDSLAENIKTMLIQEIDDLRTRIENIQQSAYQERQKKQEEGFAPIREKLIEAISQVGKENGYTYIVNPEALLYVGESVIDATDKVKAKLGLIK